MIAIMFAIMVLIVIISVIILVVLLIANEIKNYVNKPVKINPINQNTQNNPVNVPGYEYYNPETYEYVKFVKAIADVTHLEVEQQRCYIIGLINQRQLSPNAMTLFDEELKKGLIKKHVKEKKVNNPLDILYSPNFCFTASNESVIKESEAKKDVEEESMEDIEDKRRKAEAEYWRKRDEEDEDEDYYNMQSLKERLIEESPDFADVADFVDLADWTL